MQIRRSRLEKEKAVLEQNSQQYSYEINEENTRLTFNFKIPQIGSIECIMLLPQTYPFHQPQVKFNLQKEQYTFLDYENFIDIDEYIEEKWTAKLTLHQIIVQIISYCQKRIHIQKPSSLLFLLFESLQRLKNYNLMIFLILLFAFFLRMLVGFGPYSGFNEAPNYGDYEAQRHWMEITHNLPPTEWYRNSSVNDRKWWPLDYPPLTAYHSKILGYISHIYDENSVKLGISRGYESPQHKTFMRFSVLISDLIIFFPACLFAVFIDTKKFNFCFKSIFLVIALCCPAFILIDHGHFQYNCCMFGLVLLGYSLCSVGAQLLGGVFFVFAINFKQLGLFYSLSFFGFLLGKIIQKSGLLDKYSYKNQFQKLFSFFVYLSQQGIVVILSFIILWIPWITSKQEIYTVLQAIFPIQRGLYQLQCSSFWFFSNIFLKWREFFDLKTLSVFSVVLNLLFSLPSLIALILQPKHRIFKLSLFTISMTFYFFSMQVHEKTILVPLMAMIINIRDFGLYYLDFQFIATSTLFRLLYVEGLSLQYFVLNILYFYFLNDMIHFMQDINLIKSLSSYHLIPKYLNSKLYNAVHQIDNYYFFYVRKFLYALEILLHIAFYFVSQPKNYPYLWALCFAVVGFIQFAIVLLRQNLIIWLEYYKYQHKIKMNIAKID